MLNRDISSTGTSEHRSLKQIGLIDLPIDSLRQLVCHIDFEDLQSLCETCTIFGFICRDVTYWRARAHISFGIDSTQYNNIYHEEIPRLEITFERLNEVEKYIYIITRFGFVTYGSENYLHPTVAFVRALINGKHRLIQRIGKLSTIDIFSLDGLSTIIVNGGKSVVELIDRVTQVHEYDMYRTVDLFGSSFPIIASMFRNDLPLRYHERLINKVIYPRLNVEGRKLVDLVKSVIDGLVNCKTIEEEFVSSVENLNVDTSKHYWTYTSVMFILAINCQKWLFDKMLAIKTPSDEDYNHAIILSLWYGSLDIFLTHPLIDFESWKAYGATISGQKPENANFVNRHMMGCGIPPNYNYLISAIQEGETVEIIGHLNLIFELYFNPVTSDEIKSELKNIFDLSMEVATIYYRLKILRLMMMRLSGEIDLSFQINNAIITGNQIIAGELLQFVDINGDNAIYYDIASQYSRSLMIRKMMREFRPGYQPAITWAVTNDNTKLLDILIIRTGGISEDMIKLAIELNSLDILGSFINNVSLERSVIIELLKYAIVSTNEEAIRMIFLLSGLGYDFITDNPSIVENDRIRSTLIINRALNDLRLK